MTPELTRAVWTLVPGCIHTAWYAAALSDAETNSLQQKVPAFVNSAAPHVNGLFQPLLTPPHALLLSVDIINSTREGIAAVLAATVMHQRLHLSAVAKGVGCDNHMGDKEGARSAASAACGEAIDVDIGRKGYPFPLEGATEIAVMLVAGPRYAPYTMRVRTVGVVVDRGEPVEYELVRLGPEGDLGRGEDQVARYVRWMEAAHRYGAGVHYDAALCEVENLVQWGPLDDAIVPLSTLQFRYDAVDEQGRKVFVDRL